VNVLLVNSNSTRCARSGYGLTPAPAGLICLASVLAKRGHRVKISQLYDHALPQDDESLPLLRREIESLLKGFAPDSIGISARNLGAARRPFNPFELIQYYSVFYDARIVRAFRMLCGAPIVMGGTAFSLEPGLYMGHARPDFGIVGEADESLPALLEALNCGQEPNNVPGLVTGSSNVDTVWQTCDHVRDLSIMGAGACDLVEDFGGRYYDPGGFAPIQTKRGCAMDCIYCTAPFFEGHAYRLRPMSHVIEEMKAYRDIWGARHFFFVDSTFNHPLSHAIEVCEAVLESGLRAKWFAEVTPAAISDELCRMMAKSGCIGATLTPDSCAESVLKSYGKAFGVAEVRNAVKLLKKHRIPFDTCLIIGGPGETEETFGQSIAFCSEHLRDDVVRFYDGMAITRRSRAFDIAVAEGLIDPSKRYADLVFQNDFRGVKAYDYFFPHVKKDRGSLLESVERACRGKRWLLTSKDYALDPVTDEFSLHPDILTRRGARPWWRGLRRRGTVIAASERTEAETQPDKQA